MERVCTGCKKAKDANQFSIKPNGKVYKQCLSCTQNRRDAQKRNCFKSYIKKYDALNWERRLVISCRKMDANRNHDFDIDIQWIKDQCLAQQNKCAHCQEDLSFEMRPGNFQKPSVDRIDNNLGHLKSNCLITCINCNIRRQDMSVDDFRAKLAAIQTHRAFIEWIHKDDDSSA